MPPYGFEHVEPAGRKEALPFRFFILGPVFGIQLVGTRLCGFLVFKSEVLPDTGKFRTMDGAALAKAEPPSIIVASAESH